MKKYLQDRKRLIFIAYIILCTTVVFIRLFSSQAYDVERVTYGFEKEEGHALTKGSVLEAEFLANYDTISGIGLYYFSNDNTFEEEKIIVDFLIEEEKVSTSEIALFQQTDKTQIFVPFEQEGVKGKKIVVRIYGEGLSSDEEKCPLIGISKYATTAQNFKVNGLKENEYLTMDAYFRISPSANIAIYLSFLIEIVAGILIYRLLISGQIIMPKISLKKNRRKEKKKKSSVLQKNLRIRVIWRKRKLIAGYFVLLLGMLVLMEYTYHFAIRDYANKGKQISINKEDSEEAYLTLKKGDILQQSFQSTNDNFGGIGFVLDIKENDTLGNIIFRIGREGSKELIFENVYNLSEMLVDEDMEKVDGYVYLEFPQIFYQSKGVHYTFSIELENEDQSAVRILLTDKGTMAKGNINDENSTFNIFLDGYYKVNLFMKNLYKILCVFLLVIISAVYFMCFITNVKCEKIFLPVVLCLGIIYCFLIPVYATPDEPSHVDTAYRISNKIMGYGDTDSPYTLYKRVEDVDINPKTDVTVESYKNLYDNFFTFCQNNTLVETYGRNNLNNATEIFYFPAAVGLTVGRILNLGVTPTMFLGRLFTLIVTALLMFWGIKQIPFGKMILFTIALLPITLQQIMSFSYDAIIIGISYVYIGYCLKLAYTEEKIDVIEAAFLIGIIIMLVTCKGGVYLPLAFLIFLIPIRKGKFTKKTFFFGTGVVLLVLLAFIKQNTGVFERLTSVQGAIVGGATMEELYSFSYLLKNPVELIRIFENTFYEQGDSLLHTTLGGRLGWLNIQLQWIVTIGFLMLLIFCALKSRNEKQYVYAKDRVWIGLICLGCFGLVMLSMLVAWTPFGSDQILGVQGRYFLPFLGLVLVILRNKRLVYQEKNDRSLIFAGCILQMFAISQILLGVFA